MFIQGMRVKHSKYGPATVQELNETFHPHHKTLGLCFIQLDHKPDHFSTDTIEVFEDDLQQIEDVQEDCI